MNALDPLTALAVVYAVMAGLMLVLWLMDRWTGNASVADVVWCIGLVSAVAWYAWSTTGDPERKILLLLMAALYGLRLGLYILLNRVIGKDEDGRYQHLRRKWGSNERIVIFGTSSCRPLPWRCSRYPFSWSCRRFPLHSVSGSWRDSWSGSPQSWEKESPTGSSRNSDPNRAIATGSVAMDSGDTHAIRITSLNGYTGGPMSSWG